RRNSTASSPRIHKPTLGPLGSAVPRLQHRVAGARTSCQLMYDSASHGTPERRPSALLMNGAEELDCARVLDTCVQSARVGLRWSQLTEQGRTRLREDGGKATWCAS